jgi:enoyl-CoA hydratase/carnithine racemase
MNLQLTEDQSMIRETVRVFAEKELDPAIGASLLNVEDMNTASCENMIVIEKEGHVAWLVINRPQKMNAMSMAMIYGLRDAIRQLDSDNEVRVIILKGEGSCFTVGLDLKEATQELIPDDSVAGHEPLRKKILNLQDCVTVFENCRKPVIAAIHGFCYGVGLDFTSACDIRIAAKDAVFSIRETKVAIIADMGSLQRMPNIVGEGWARELALTGRDFTAVEALKMGLVTHICTDCDDLYVRAGELAREIAANSPLAVEGAKEVLNYTRDHGVEAGLEYVAHKNAVALYCEDFKEAMQAFAEKRPPVFSGK